MNWQAVEAIGTCFMGVALAFFAYLTWRLSKQQQQLLYTPKLGGKLLDDCPKVGKDVIVGEREGIKIHFDGIYWVANITNLGPIPIYISDTVATVINTTTGDKCKIWPGPYCKVFRSKVYDLEESSPRFTIPAGKNFKRHFVICSPQFQDTLQTINYTEVRGTVVIEVKFVWEAGEITSEVLLTSNEFRLPADISFSERSEGSRLI